MCEAQILRLKKENDELKEELQFLKTFPTLAQGMRGQALVARIEGSVTTGYGCSYDLVINGGARLEVKNSHVNTPNRSSTRRWSWSNLLGSPKKRKDYDFLVLIGKRDERFSYYQDNSPYVFFLLPHREVPNIVTAPNAPSGMCTLSTNLDGTRAPKSQLLKNRLVSWRKLEESLALEVAAGRRPVGEKV